MMGETMMPYLEACGLLERYGVGLPPWRLAASADGAVEAAAVAVELGFPLAVKAIAPTLSHKSDLGLVRLGLESDEAVRQAAEALLEAVAAAGAVADLEGLLVQRMAPAGVEMILGVQYDAQFGPVVALGSGGVLVELLDDAVLRVPPLTQRQALDMMRETRSWPLLQGFRHYPAADLAALAQLVVQVARLATAEEGRIGGLDLNPVIVLPEGQGVAVVDVRVATK